MDTQSVAGSVTDTANTNIKALIATAEEDQRFVYKKHDNYIVMVFRLAVFPGYNVDNHDVCFGF